MNNLTKPGDFILFNKDIFTKNYFDLENDEPNEVLILNDMIYGILTLDNKILGKDSVFKVSDSEKLKYIRISNLEYSEEINFKINDLNQNNKFSDMATFTINVNAYINLPPDQIGDNEITVENGETYVFTIEDFTANTTPPYDDPEGDAPYKLKILSLPLDGSKLILNGVLCSINDEILFTDIEDGLFTCEQFLDNIEHSFSFDFTISDVGSEEYYEE